MDYMKMLSIVEDRLSQNYPKIIEDVKHCIAAGSTGGEIMSIVGYYLKDLEKFNNEAYEIIEHEIHKYIQECQKLGIYIK